MKSNMLIRESTPDDYHAIAEIHNALDPTDPQTAANIAERNELRDPKCQYRHWVATCDEQVVATGVYTQNIYDYDPGKFVIRVRVHPNHQRRGIGRSLYNHVMTNLEPHKPAIIQTWTNENCFDAIKMLELEGFVEVHRSGVSELDVRGFDPAGFETRESSFQERGIEIKTMTELDSDTGRDRKLYDLDWEIMQDIPGLRTVTRVDFETFVREMLRSPHHRPEGNFVAVHSDEYVGMSLLQLNPEDQKLNQTSTGVKRAYRRQGIALVLKLRTIAFAKANGFSAIRTTNDINNRPMLAINERLGFVRSSVWIHYEKHCAEAM